MPMGRGTPFVYTPRKKQNPVPIIGTPRSHNRNIRKGSKKGSVCSQNGNISAAPKCSQNRNTSRLASTRPDPTAGQGSSSRVPACAVDAGSNPAPEAKQKTTAGRPAMAGDYPCRSVQQMSDGLLPPSPPGEKATARGYETGKASTDDGTGNGCDGKQLGSDLSTGKI